MNEAISVAIVEHKKSYAQYLTACYDYCVRTGTWPVSFKDFCEGKVPNVNYHVVVTVSESNDVAAMMCSDFISVVAPSGLRMDQLKEFIKKSSMPIEERLKIQTPVGTLGSGVEIYDYDLVLVKITLKEATK